MHSFHGKEITIHYNSDMSGDCQIIDRKTNTEIAVPCEDLVDFVAEYVRRQKIDELEQMGSKELLGLL